MGRTEAIPDASIAKESIRGRWIYWRARAQEHRSAILLLTFDHINFLGRYAFALPDSVAHGQLRPLRSPDAPRIE